MTRNRFLDKVRRDKPVAVLQEEMVDEGVPNPEFAAQRLEDAHRVRRALASLPQTQREALVLREVHDLSYADIAQVLGLSLANIKVTLFRARSAFQEAYGLKLLLEEPTPECPGVSSLLGEARDGELAEDQLSALRRHVKTCSACRERRDRLAFVASLVALPSPFAAPPGLADRILKSVERTSSPQSSGARSSVVKTGGGPGGEAVKTYARWVVFGGVAAVVLGLVGYGLVSYLRYRRRATRALAPVEFWRRCRSTARSAATW